MYYNNVDAACENQAEHMKPTSVHETSFHQCKISWHLHQQETLKLLKLKKITYEGCIFSLWVSNVDPIALSWTLKANFTPNTRRKCSFGFITYPYKECLTDLSLWQSVYNELAYDERYLNHIFMHFNLALLHVIFGNYQVVTRRWICKIVIVAV